MPHSQRVNDGRVVPEGVRIMQVALSMLAGLVVGVVLFLLTRKHANVAMWTALVLGVIGSVLFMGTINGWFLPEAGRFQAIGIGLLSGVAAVLAAGCLLRGERRPLNWIALLVSAPPVLFMIIFGLGELFGPAH